MAYKDGSSATFNCLEAVMRHHAHSANTHPANARILVLCKNHGFQEMNIYTRSCFWCLQGLPEFSSLEKAENIAAAIHNGELYGNKPYIEHPKEVARLLKLWGENSAIQVAGWLHDVVETGRITPFDIWEVFNKKIKHQVEWLTRKDNETYFDYIRRLDGVARRIKLADVMVNLANHPNESLTNRYLKAVGILTRRNR